MRKVLLRLRRKVRAHRRRSEHDEAKCKPIRLSQPITDEAIADEQIRQQCSGEIHMALWVEQWIDAELARLPTMRTRARR